MSLEGFVMFLAVFEFFVARPKVFLWACQVVVGPLSRKQVEGCAAKILVLIAGGGALAKSRGGQSTQKKKKTYDCTLGYPGEDGALQLQQLLIPHQISP